MENPFQYGKVVSDPSFTDRRQELREMLAEIQSLHSLVLYSPRRYGKTSLLCKVAEQARDLGYKTIFIDFFRVNSRAAFVEIYAREILGQYRKSWRTILKKMASLASGIRPKVSLDTFGNLSFSIDIEAQGDQRLDLEAVLDLPESLDPQQKWLIIFDEFQELAKLNGISFEDLLRARLQHHQRSSYIFCGSQYHLLLKMFNLPSRPFYRFGKLMRLEKIAPAVMADFVWERFGATNTPISREMAQHIVRLADNIPNYVQYIASEFWQLLRLSGRQPSEDLLREAMQKIIQSQKDYFLQIWDGLSPQQRKLLLALSEENSNIFSEEYHKRHRLGAISSSQTAARKLVADQLIVKEGFAYLFADPLFRQYLKTQMTIS